MHQTIKEKYNYEMKFMRPPMGEFSERTLIDTANLGYKTVMWSFAYKDWEEKKATTRTRSTKNNYRKLSLRRNNVITRKF